MSAGKDKQEDSPVADVKVEKKENSSWQEATVTREDGSSAEGSGLSKSSAIENAAAKTKK